MSQGPAAPEAQLLRAILAAGHLPALEGGGRGGQGRLPAGASRPRGLQGTSMACRVLRSFLPEAIGSGTST
eukprot:7702828-Alexandrium_andersonii.AAC.1